MVTRISPFPVCFRNNISNCIFHTPGFAVLSSEHMEHQNIFSFKPGHSFSRVTNHFFAVFQEAMMYPPVSPWRSLRVNIQSFDLQALNNRMLRMQTVRNMPLRPPGVSDEARFVEKCLRCFQCVRSCPNKIIKITGFESGLNNLFTPHLEFHEFGCDYNCQVCQLACPNFAIPLQTLREKQSAKIGLASIDEKLCVVFARDTNCLVCEEFCPVTDKAIKIRKI